ncbi:hypothetical protein FRB97_008290, partial [Tulasnella sp. 331]
MHLYVLIVAFTFLLAQVVTSAPLSTDLSEMAIPLTELNPTQPDSDMQTPERRAVTWQEDERLAELKTWYSYHHTTAADALAPEALELEILLQEWIREYQTRRLHATKKAAHREQALYAKLADQLSIAYTTTIAKLVEEYHKGTRGVKRALSELLQRFFVL